MKRPDGIAASSLALFAAAIVAVLAAVFAPAAQAKDDEVRLADVWDATAKRAEEALRNAQASNQALETLRAELALQRTQAFAITEGGSIDTRSLKAQLDALGPKPAGGASEYPALAERRAELEAALAKADEPVIEAKQAYRRAEVLIEAIDRSIRARERADLVARYPTPVFPSRWVAAGGEFLGYLEKVREEMARDLGSPTSEVTLKARLILASAFAAFGMLVLFVLLPFMLSRGERRIERSYSPLVLQLHVAYVYTVRLVVPLIGAYSLVLAFLALDVTASSARSLKTLVATAPILPVAAYWLSHLFFAPNLPLRRVIDLGNRASIAVRICVTLGFVLFVEVTLETMVGDFAFSDIFESVASTVVVALGSLLMWRLAHVLRHAKGLADDNPGAAETQVGASVFLLLIQLIRIAALASIATALIGYVGLSRYALVPMILTLGLFGLMLAVYRGFIVVFEALFSGARADKVPGLAVFVPPAIGLIVGVASLPALALIWGARTAEVGEFWVLLSQGVEVGDTRVSATVVLTAIVVFFGGVLITRWLQRLLAKAVLPKTHLDSGAQSAIVTGTSYAGVTLSVLLAIAAAGINLSSLAIVFGALSVGIGFGLQAITSNFISGIILLVERPIKEGDWIEVSGHSGIVKKIAVRSTRIETFDRHSVIVPNSDLITNTVTNMTLDNKTGRVIVPVGVAYGSDLEKTRNVLVEAAKAHPLVMAEPEPAVLFMGLGESSLDFELRCFVDDVGTVLSVKSDLLYAIYRTLDELGIAIPFPQRDLHLDGLDRLVEAIEKRPVE